MALSRPGKILFVTYGAGHARIAAKVAQKLAADSRLSCAILALTTASQVMDEAGLEYRRCCDFLPMPGYEQASAFGAELADQLWSESSPVSYEETCAYLGTSMVDLVREVGESNAKQAYASRGRKAFKPVGFLTRVLSEIRPHVVVTTCHVRMERAATIAARKSGIPSLLIEDLFGYTMLGELPFDSREVALPKEEWPTKVAVWNDFVKQRMVNAGLPEQMVVITGQPVLSEWPHVGHEEQGLGMELSRDPRPVVTYTSTATRQFVYEQVPILIDLARRRTDWLFIFKLHPSLSLQEFESIGYQLPANVRLLWRDDIAQLLQNSDVVIQLQSTTGLLAIISGKPLIVLNTTGYPELLPYVSHGGAIRVTRGDQLEAAVSKCLATGIRETDPTGVFDNPPDAAARIIEVLAELRSHSSQTDCRDQAA